MSRLISGSFLSFVILVEYLQPFDELVELAGIVVVLSVREVEAVVISPLRGRASGIRLRAFGLTGQLGYDN